MAALPWREILQSDDYQRLGSKDRVQMQRDYFAEVVLPQVGKDNAEAAWSEFIEAYPLGGAPAAVPGARGGLLTAAGGDEQGSVAAAPTFPSGPAVDAGGAPDLYTAPAGPLLDGQLAAPPTTADVPVDATIADQHEAQLAELLGQWSEGELASLMKVAEEHGSATLWEALQTGLAVLGIEPEMVADLPPDELTRLYLWLVHPATDDLGFEDPDYAAAPPPDVSRETLAAAPMPTAMEAGPSAMQRILGGLTPGKTAEEYQAQAAAGGGGAIGAGLKRGMQASLAATGAGGPLPANLVGAAGLAAANEALLGLPKSALEAAYGPGAWPEAENTAERVAVGLGALAGFVAGPSKIAKAERVLLARRLPWVKKLLGRTQLKAADLLYSPRSSVRRWAKMAATEASHLAEAIGLARTGDVLAQTSLTDALKVAGQARLEGAEMGLAFATGTALIPGRIGADLMRRGGEWLARWAGVSALLDLFHGQKPGEGLVYDVDPDQLADRIFQYGINALFTMHGAAGQIEKSYPGLREAARRQHPTPWTERLLYAPGEAPSPRTQPRPRPALPAAEGPPPGPGARRGRGLETAQLLSDQERRRTRPPTRVRQAEVEPVLAADKAEWAGEAANVAGALEAYARSRQLMAEDEGLPDALYDDLEGLDWEEGLGRVKGEAQRRFGREVWEDFLENAGYRGVRGEPEVWESVTGKTYPRQADAQRALDAAREGGQYADMSLHANEDGTWSILGRRRPAPERMLPPGQPESAILGEGPPARAGRVEDVRGREAPLTESRASERAPERPAERRPTRTPIEVWVNPPERGARGQAAPFRPDLGGRARREVERALAAGDTDAGAAALARRLIEIDPTFDETTSLEISQTVMKVTRQGLEDWGLGDLSPEDVEVPGVTYADHAAGNLRTAVRLMAGHDAQSVVHEFSHDWWYRLTEEQQAPFHDYYESHDNPQNLSEEELFAEEATAFFFSEKMHEAAGPIRTLFAQARDTLRALIGGIRKIRGAKIPKKIQDLYRQAGERIPVDRAGRWGYPSNEIADMGAAPSPLAPRGDRTAGSATGTRAGVGEGAAPFRAQPDISRLPVPAQGELFESYSLRVKPRTLRGKKGPLRSVEYEIVGGSGRGLTGRIHYPQRDFSRFGTKAHDQVALEAWMDHLLGVPEKDRNRWIDLRMGSAKLEGQPLMAISSGCGRHAAILSAVEAGEAPADAVRLLTSCHGDACYKEADTAALSGASPFSKLIERGRKGDMDARRRLRQLAGELGVKGFRLLDVDPKISADGKRSDKPRLAAMKDAFSQMSTADRRRLYRELHAAGEYPNLYVPQSAMSPQVPDAEVAAKYAQSLRPKTVARYRRSPFIRNNQAGDWMQEILPLDGNEGAWQAFVREAERKGLGRAAGQKWSVVTTGYYADVPFDLLREIQREFGDGLLVQHSGGIDFEPWECRLRTKGYHRLREAGLEPVMRLITDEFGQFGRLLSHPQSIATTLEYIAATGLPPRAILETPLHIDTPGFAGTTAKSIEPMARRIAERHQVPMEEAMDMALRIAERNRVYKLADPELHERVKDLLRRAQAAEGAERRELQAEARRLKRLPRYPIGHGEVGLSYERLWDIGVMTPRLERQLKKLGYLNRYMRMGKEYEGLFGQQCCVTGRCSTCSAKGGALIDVADRGADPSGPIPERVQRRLRKMDPTSAAYATSGPRKRSFQVRPKQGRRYDDIDELGFYSPTRRALTGLPMGKTEIGAALQKRLLQHSGVKDELLWTGMDTWFEERANEKLTRAQVLDELARRNEQLALDEWRRGETQHVKRQPIAPHRTLRDLARSEGVPGDTPTDEIPGHRWVTLDMPHRGAKVHIFLPHELADREEATWERLKASRESDENRKKLMKDAKEKAIQQMRVTGGAFNMDPSRLSVTPEQVNRLYLESLIEKEIRAITDISTRFEYRGGDGRYHAVEYQITDHGASFSDPNRRFTADYIGGYIGGLSPGFKTMEEAKQFLWSGEINREEYTPTSYGRYSTGGPETGENYREILIMLPKWEGRAFRSSHWSQPGEENPVAHVRVKDFADPDGKKVLLVDEIQSDWSTELRQAKYGILPERLTEDMFRIHRATEGPRLKHIEFNPDPKGGGEWKSLRTQVWSDDKVKAAFKELASGGARGEIALHLNTILRADSAEPVPWASSSKWIELVAKRILRMAAEGGYDKVAWTTGEQQVRRYSEALAGLVDEVQVVSTAVTSKGEKKYAVELWNNSERDYGEPVWESNGYATEAQLRGQIGASLAKQIVEQAAEHEAAGLDFPLSWNPPEGTHFEAGWPKKLYDVNLRNVMSKLGKRFGAKPGETELGGHRSLEDRLADIYRQGLYYDDYPSAAGALDAAAEEYRMSIWHRTRRGPGLKDKWELHKDNITDREELDLWFTGAEDASERLGSDEVVIVADAELEKGIGGMKVGEKYHALDVTPDLKRSAMDAGFSKFQVRRRQPQDAEIDHASREAREAVKRAKRASKKNRMASLGRKLLVPLSSRARRVDPAVERAVRGYTIGYRLETLETTAKVLPWLETLKRVRKRSAEDYELLHEALQNADPNTAYEIVGEEGLSALKDNEAVLENIRQRYIESGGKMEGTVSYYYPRRVKDYEGLMTFLYDADPTAYGQLQKLINKKRARLLETKDRDITDEERNQIVNNFLAGRVPPGTGRPRAAKRRTIPRVTESIRKFYYDPETALIRHIEEMERAIARNKFFGKGANSEESIGHFVRQLMDEGKIMAAQQREVKDICAALLRHEPSSNAVRWLKTLGYMATMGSHTSGITQFGDLAWSLYESGFYETSKAVGKTVGRKLDISRKDLGLERISAEFERPDKAGWALDALFTTIFLKHIDVLGKESLINSTLARYQREARRGRASRRLQRDLARYFGEDWQRLIPQLASGKVTPDIKYFLANKLLDWQPLAESEMPEYYQNHPNGRISYMLQTFTLKQFDAFRRECFDLMGSESRADRIEGFQNLIRLTIAFTLMNATADVIKDLIMGRPIHFTELMQDQLARLVGVSRFFAWQIRRYGPLEAGAKLVMPPHFSLGSKWHKDYLYIERQWKKGEPIEIDKLHSVQMVPIIGKPYYWWFGRGRSMLEEREAEREADQAPPPRSRSRRPSRRPRR